MKNIRFIIAIVLLLSLFSASTSGQVRVVAQVDTSEDIYVGQSFRYLVIIDGDDKPGHVDMSPLTQYNPRNT